MVGLCFEEKAMVCWTVSLHRQQWLGQWQQWKNRMNILYWAEEQRCQSLLL